MGAFVPDALPTTAFIITTLFNGVLHCFKHLSQHYISPSRLKALGRAETGGGCYVINSRPTQSVDQFSSHRVDGREVQAVEVLLAEAVAHRRVRLFILAENNRNGHRKGGGGVGAVVWLQ